MLRSNPIALSADQKITRVEFNDLHEVASKYFRLVFIDSGNDESAERWQQMIDQTNQLVIATTALGEHAEAGALLLEALAGGVREFGASTTLGSLFRVGWRS